MNDFKLIIPFGESICLFNDLNIDDNKLITQIKKCKFKSTFLNNKAYITEDIKILDNISYGKEVKDMFLTRILQSIKAMGYEVPIKIGTSWATLTKPKSESHYHMHSNYWLSACYYPMGDIKDDFSIMFKRPTPLFFDIPRIGYSSFNSSDYKLNIKKGDFIVFSSALDHKIFYNNTKKDRISLALNIIPNSIVGNDDSLIDYSVVK